MGLSEARARRDGREVLAHRAGMVEAAPGRPEQPAAQVVPFRAARGAAARARSVSASAFSYQPPSGSKLKAMRDQASARPIMARGGVGVQLERLLEALDRARDRRKARLGKEQKASLQVELVRGSGDGPGRAGEPSLVGRRQADLQRFGDPPRDLVLHGEDVLERGVDLRSPERPSRSRLDELHGDAQPRARALEAAVEDGIDGQLAAGLLRVGRTVAVFQDRRGRADEERLHERELRDRRVRQAHAELRLGGGTRQVLERQHRDRAPASRAGFLLLPAAAPRAPRAQTRGRGRAGSAAPDPSRDSAGSRARSHR